jgi:branched-chain amino acid transport system substrate-binding protein
VLLACGVGNSTSSTGSSVLRVTAIQPLTGPSAAAGKQSLSGSLFAARQIKDSGGLANQAGGKFTVDVTGVDAANDPTEAIALIRQAASDQGVIAAIGPSASNLFVPAVPVAGQLKIPFVGAGPLSPVTNWNQWVYRVNPVVANGSPLFYKLLVSKLSLKKVSAIYDQTNGAQTADAETLKSLASSLGITVEPYIAFRSGDADFSAAVSQIKAAKPDAILVAAQIGDGPRIVTQLAAAGVSVPLMTGFGGFTFPQYWTDSHGLIKGAYTWQAADIADATGSLKTLAASYNAANPDSGGFTVYALYGFDAVYTIAAAIQKASNATDRSAVQHALSSLHYTSPSGTEVTYKNPPSGDNQTATVVVVQITGAGQYVAVQ